MSDDAGWYGFLCVIIKGPMPFAIFVLIRRYALAQLTTQIFSLSRKLSRLIGCSLNVGFVCFRFVVGINTHFLPIILIFYSSIHV